MINIKLLIDKAKRLELFEEQIYNRLFIDVVRRFISPILMKGPGPEQNNEAIIKVCDGILSDKDQLNQDMITIVEFLKSLTIENQKVEFSEEKTYTTIKEYVELNPGITQREVIEFFKDDQLMNPMYLRKAVVKVWK
jgi:hypothetical protein